MKEEGTGEQERCIAVDFLKIKMLVVIKKYWKLKIIDLMSSTLPSGIFFQTISTWSSLSGRLCSCQNPRACPTHTKKIQKQCSLACNLFLSMIDVTHPFHEQLFLDTSSRWPVKSAAFHLDVQHMTNIFAKQKQVQ